MDCNRRADIAYYIIWETVSFCYSDYFVNSCFNDIETDDPLKTGLSTFGHKICAAVWLFSLGLHAPQLYFMTHDDGGIVFYFTNRIMNSSVK